MSSDKNSEEKATLSLEEFFIERLTMIMNERHLTRYRLGQLTGITQASLSTILTGKSAPSLGTIEKLCTGLGISVSDFFNQDGEENYPISLEERKALRYWHELDKTQKKMAVAFAEGMLAQEKLSKL